MCLNSSCWIQWDHNVFITYTVCIHTQDLGILYARCCENSQQSYWRLLLVQILLLLHQPRVSQTCHQLGLCLFRSQQCWQKGTGAGLQPYTTSRGEFATEQWREGVAGGWNEAARGQFRSSSGQWDRPLPYPNQCPELEHPTWGCLDLVGANTSNPIG